MPLIVSKIIKQWEDRLGQDLTQLKKHTFNVSVINGEEVWMLNVKVYIRKNKKFRSMRTNVSQEF